MRIRIIFQVMNPGATVPFHHQFLLANLIESLKVKEYKNFTFYNFSGIKGHTRLERYGLHFTSHRITIVLSSFNQSFINFFLDALFKEKEITISNLVLKPLFTEEEIMPKLEAANKFLCISPIVALDPGDKSLDHKKFITPVRDDFSDYLYDITMERMESSGLFKSKEISSFFKFQVIPDRNYLAKIEAEGKKFARIFPAYEDQSNYEVRGYTFPFTLYAAPPVQEFLFINGMGYFNHKGFGMLDLADAELKPGNVPYNFK